jgi:hypothetical protein
LGRQILGGASTTKLKVESWRGWRRSFVIGVRTGDSNQGQEREERTIMSCHWLCSTPEKAKRHVSGGSGKSRGVRQGNSKSRRSSRRAQIASASMVARGGIRVKQTAWGASQNCPVAGVMGKAWLGEPLCIKFERREMTASESQSMGSPTMVLTVRSGSKANETVMGESAVSMQGACHRITAQSDCPGPLKKRNQQGLEWPAKLDWFNWIGVVERNELSKNIGWFRFQPKVERKVAGVQSAASVHEMSFSGQRSEQADKQQQCKENEGRQDPVWNAWSWSEALLEGQETKRQETESQDSDPRKEKIVLGGEGSKQRRQKRVHRGQLDPMARSWVAA